ncbi:MAG: hypothetical protein ABI833_01425 [Acidobacteriota bacterium]
MHFILVTNQQLYLATGIPMLFNATLIGLFAVHDDMRDLWRAELRRVEGVLDARLRHLEERR